MTIEKIDGIWAETGDLGTEPTAAKKTAGFVGDDQPECERYNYLINRIDVAINRMITERLNSFYSEAATPLDMLTTEIWDESWGRTVDSNNQISGGATKKYKDLAVFFDTNSNPFLIVADDTNQKFEIWNARLMTNTSTSDAWTDDLPSGTFACQSICTDGTSVYAVFIDTNASPDEYHIQAWDIETWDVKSGWGSTGTQLTLASDAAVHKVIIANSSYLAVINDTQGITVAGSAAIEIIDITDGSLDADGAGDATTGVGDDVKADPCIVSDGTNLFFCVYKTSTTNLYLCSATIADPTTGSGGSNYPLNTNQNAHCGGMTGAGTGAVALLNHVSADAHDDVVLYTFDASDADLAKIERGQNANSIVCDEYVYEDCNDMVFDGINIWAFVLIQNPTDRMALLKIDSSKLIWDEQEGGDKYLDDINPSLFLLPAGHTALGSPQMGLTFDGRDVWSLVEHSASQTLSGKIVRLPLGLIRS